MAHHRGRADAVQRQHLGGGVHGLLDLVALFQHAGQIEPRIVKIRRNRDHATQQALGLARPFGFVRHTGEHAKRVHVARVCLQGAAQQRLALAQAAGALMCGSLQKPTSGGTCLEVLRKERVGFFALALCDQRLRQTPARGHRRRVNRCSALQAEDGLVHTTQLQQRAPPLFPCAGMLRRNNHCLLQDL